MRVRVVRGAELGPELRLRWTALQQERGALGSPYLGPAFVEAAATCRPNVRVGVIEDAGRPVGFLPFECGPRGIGDPVGGCMSDFQAPILAPGVRCEPRQLVAGCGLRLWRFHHLLAEAAEFQPHVARTCGSPTLDLRGGYARYRSLRSSTECIDRVFAKARRLRSHHSDVHFEFDSRDAGAFEQVVRWKRQQCSRTGTADFLAEPHNDALIRTIRDTHTAAFAGMLSVLRVDGRIAAAHFDMRSVDTLHYWLPSYEPDFAHYSPGLILLLEIIRASADAGLCRLDLGKGDEPYKRSFCTGEIAIGEGEVVVSPLLARLRQWHAAGIDFVRRAPLAAPLRRPVRALRQRLLRRRAEAAARLPGAEAS